jgi:hypothetical protein
MESVFRKLECVGSLGEWTVVEYEPFSGRRITMWDFPSFGDAEAFRRMRMGFYRSIGFEKIRDLTPALPKISDAEMKLFETIIQNPAWMTQIMHQFVR